MMQEIEEKVRAMSEQAGLSGSEDEFEMDDDDDFDLRLSDGADE